ncbi:MAG: 3-deoxy-8-phosphooctulonate synthase, partial [Alphaproteobacteria bacterium]|nr:3-deoxy-8-phosphooctulonate synthase [Alphaproteobacteria bacterium]
MTVPHQIPLHNFKIGNNLPFVLIAGPCVLESRGHAFDMAGALKEMTQKLDIPLIYKSSFDKANRTSLKAGRGMGIEKGLTVFDDLRREMILPIITDVHAPEQCAEVA